MAYVLTDGATTVVAYPYDYTQLKLANPNVSFPLVPDETTLADYNVFPVTPVQPEEIDPLSQDLNEGTPEFDGESGWRQVWIVTNVSAEVEAARRAEAYANGVERTNAEAARLLDDTNRFALAAFEESRTLTPEFLAYRASLRDPSTLPGYPMATEFPATPANVFVEVVDLSETFEDSL